MSRLCLLRGSAHGGRGRAREGAGGDDARPLSSADDARGAALGDGAAAGMQRATEGAGGARTAKPQGGAIRPDPALGQQGGQRLGSVGRGRRHSSKARVRGRSHGSRMASMALDLAPYRFVIRVLLEETGEMFTVTHCHGDMTVQELKEELDLAAGIPLNLQLLQYLDQGGAFSTPPLALLFPGPGCPISSERPDAKGKQPDEDPQVS